MEEITPTPQKKCSISKKHVHRLMCYNFKKPKDGLSGETWCPDCPGSVKASENPWEIYGLHGYPLVNIQKTSKNDGKSQVLMGKSTINGNFQ